ncbi:MAG: sugar ABC transporter permease [Clostridiaceae bacterium]|nr:sugar ABC transporter permease [Clostridiaceae bacterium]
MKKNKNQWMGYICLLPLALLLCLFLFYPFLNGFYLSFFSTKYGFGDLKFSGLQNYISLIKLEKMKIALVNSLIWVFASVLLNSFIPLLLAVALNRNFRGKTFVIAALLIPWVTPVVGFAMMNKWLLEPDVGVIGGILKKAGLLVQGINFLGRKDLALPTLIILNFWQFMPFGVLLLTSALSTISEELYDAMKVDGATWIQILKNLILPNVGNMIGFLMFLGTVWTFSNYSLIYLLTKGGPANSTYTVPILIFEKAFTEFNVGQSVALASLVGIVLITFGIWYFRKMNMSKEG